MASKQSEALPPCALALPVTLRPAHSAGVLCLLPLPAMVVLQSAPTNLHVLSHDLIFLFPNCRSTLVAACLMFSESPSQPEFQRLYSFCEVTSAAQLRHKTSHLPPPSHGQNHGSGVLPPQCLSVTPFSSAHHHCACLVSCLALHLPACPAGCVLLLHNYFVSSSTFQYIPQHQVQTDF